MANKPFYITTTLPYVNAEPHVGHAMEFIRADVVARYKKLRGFDVFFNIGTDEHGIKVYRKAQELGQDTQAYVNDCAKRFKDLQSVLKMLPDLNFVRTTDEKHINSAKEFWKLCSKNGYIYKKKYQTKYCSGCELEKTDSELVDGKCPIHLNLTIDLIDEENYFFKFSAFGEKLTKFYESNPGFVVPHSRFSEIKSFVSRGLSDFSISRVKSKMPWGIEVPDDSEQVMYVWFDALVNYISVIGWPTEMDTFKKWMVDTGGMIQYCGKDNLRQQSAMWQAMLMSVDLPNSQKVIIDGFITGDGGVKMSKSLGNVINPLDVVNEYGAEALRYFVCREIHPFEDSPFTMERFKLAYNSALANGVGNLTSRIMKMASGLGVKSSYGNDLNNIPKDSEDVKTYEDAINSFDLQNASNVVWKLISNADEYIQTNQPFKLVKTAPEEGKKHIQILVNNLHIISYLLMPFMPETSEAISKCVVDGVSPEKALFMRKD